MIVNWDIFYIMKAKIEEGSFVVRNYVGDDTEAAFKLGIDFTTKLVEYMEQTNNE
jgi:hypothetical protein